MTLPALTRAAVRLVVVLAAQPIFADSVHASGHGPIFGMATPTNAAGAWSIDFGAMGRAGEDKNGLMLRTMIARGITEDIQISVSAPFVLAKAPFPASRSTAMMPSTGDVEALGAWRFKRDGRSVGTRVESTAYAGIIVPGVQRPAGMGGTIRRAPGVYSALSTGVASRSHYLWGGLGYTRFAEVSGDRRGSLVSYSVVWGYRPPPLRKDYPHWDWRGFLELTGERAGAIRRARRDYPETAAHQVFVGPAALGIYKNIAVEGGVQLPVYRRSGSKLTRESVRYAVNFSRFF